MKVLIVSMVYDYGDKLRGLSGDHYYFVKPIEKIVDSVICFDYMSILKERGRERMNRDLLSTVEQEHPDITLFVPFGDQFIPEVIGEANKDTITVGYYFDDSWRVTYSRFWANYFTFVTTSDINGVSRFRAAGCRNVIYSPFGCNCTAYQKMNLPKKYDVSFIGAYHPYREWCFQLLRKAGVEVHCWGYGWKTGRLEFSDMLNVLNQSKINLNLSNCVSWDIRYMVSSLRAMKNTLGSARRADPKVREMVKGRHFEINACGGFQLSYYVEGLERFYQIGEEVAIFTTPEELVEKTRYFLNHDGERDKIAERGYVRTLRDHTLERRFRDLFAEVQQRR